MGLFSGQTFNDLNELLVGQLRDLYDAEHRILEALPKMAKKASAFELKKAFEDHRTETETHITRLERIFEILGEDPKRETCQAAQGLIKEGSEIIDADGPSSVIDVGLILAAQRVEHYEIAGYGGAKALAETLEKTDISLILDATLSEEKQTDAILSEIATTKINFKASKAAAMPAQS